MRPFSICFVVLGFIAAVSASCSASMQAVAPGVPAYDVTAPNGIRSILIGNLHEPADGLIQPAPEVMDGARFYVVEGVPEAGVKSSAQEVDRDVAGGFATRAPWAMDLTDSQLDDLKRRALCNPPFDTKGEAFADLFIRYALKLRRPEVLAGLALYQCASPSLLSRDQLLDRAAAAHHLAKSPLESQAAATAQRDAVSDRIYQELLLGSFKSSARAAVSRAVRALNGGDFGEIARIMADALPPEDAKSFYETMVAARNRAWMPVLTRYLDEGPAVVTVGAYHLPGPDGLVAMLISSGYKVKLRSLPAGPAF